MAEYIREVEPELLIKANEKVGTDLEKYESPDVMVSIVTALGRDHEVDEITAVSYRLIALAKLLSSGEGGQWTMSVEGNEYALVNQALFRAAAKAPLQERRTVGEHKFEPKEFLQIALQEVDTKGSA
jgi:hypothetical protein